MLSGLFIHPSACIKLGCITPACILSDLRFFLFVLLHPSFKLLPVLSGVASYHLPPLLCSAPNCHLPTPLASRCVLFLFPLPPRRSLVRSLLGALLPRCHTSRVPFVHSPCLASTQPASRRPSRLTHHDLDWPSLSTLSLNCTYRLPLEAQSMSLHLIPSMHLIFWAFVASPSYCAPSFSDSKQRRIAFSLFRHLH